MTIILNPVASARDSSNATTPQIASLEGRTIGILSNHWKSMDRIAVRMQTQLREKYGAADVRFYDIPINGAMADKVKAAAIAECDAAIVGLAN